MHLHEDARHIFRSKGSNNCLHSTKAKSDRTVIEATCMCSVHLDNANFHKFRGISIDAVIFYSSIQAKLLSTLKICAILSHIVWLSVEKNASYTTSHPILESFKRQLGGSMLLKTKP